MMPTPTPVASFVVTPSVVPARPGDVQDVTPVVAPRRKPVAITAAVIEARRVDVAQRVAATATIERINSRKKKAS